MEGSDKAERVDKILKGWVPFSEYALPTVCRKRMIKVYLTATPGKNLLPW